jgi:hypothetical protein
MIAEQFISIKKGDASTFTEAISGISSTTGYSAKMYVYDADNTAILTVSGTVGTLSVVYEITNEDTKALTAGTYSYETKLFDTTDHVYSQGHGIFEIRSTNEEDPS